MDLVADCGRTCSKVPELLSIAILCISSRLEVGKEEVYMLNRLVNLFSRIHSCLR